MLTHFFTLFITDVRLKFDSTCERPINAIFGRGTKDTTGFPLVCLVLYESINPRRLACVLTPQKPEQWPKVGEYDHRILKVQVYTCMLITAVYLHRVGLSQVPSSICATPT